MLVRSCLCNIMFRNLLLIVIVSTAFREVPMKLGRLALIAAAIAVTTTASAEIIIVNDTVAVRESSVQRPARGMSMDKVEAQFGAPAQRHAAVGQPAITRWDYPGFSVFF